jgi:hypothetical protein
MKTTRPDNLTLDMTQAEVNEFIERKLRESFGPEIEFLISCTRFLRLLDSTPAAPAEQQTGQTS